MSKNFTHQRKEALTARELLCWAAFKTAALKFRSGVKECLISNSSWAGLPDYLEKDLGPSRDFSPANETQIDLALGQVKEFQVIYLSGECENQRGELISSAHMRGRVNRFFRGMA